jgi:hypothetical protein
VPEETIGLLLLADVYFLKRLLWLKITDCTGKGIFNFPSLWFFFAVEYHKPVSENKITSWEFIICVSFTLNAQVLRYIPEHSVIYNRPFFTR